MRNWSQLAGGLRDAEIRAAAWSAREEAGEPGAAEALQAALAEYRRLLYAVRDAAQELIDSMECQE